MLNHDDINTTVCTRVFGFLLTFGMLISMIACQSPQTWSLDSTSDRADATAQVPSPVELAPDAVETPKPVLPIDGTATVTEVAAPPLSAADAEVAVSLGFDPAVIADLVHRPLYTFSNAEVDRYLRFLHATMPGLRDRVVHLARKNLGQSYEIYLLGEAPFELYDPQPIYSIAKSDCVVYVEHTFAMALSLDWPTFMAMLQRIRYTDGRIGVVTRNHYTEADWNAQNTWLVDDLSDDLPTRLVKTYTQRVDRAQLYHKRYRIVKDIPVETITCGYVPVEHALEAGEYLQEGDVVNFVRGRVDVDGNPTGKWVGHVGLVARGEDGAVHIIHSTRPVVKEQALSELVDWAKDTREERIAEGKTVTFGYNFLRLRDDPWANLRAIDGPNAPVVTLPHRAELVSPSR